MNKIIAKLLVVVMVMTTVVMPANFSFAETADGQQATATESSSEAPSGNDASKEEPSVDQKTESQTKQSDAGAVESKPGDAQQPSTLDSSTDAANEEAEQLVTEEMNFLYIESPQLVAPGTQNLVVSWKDSIDEITKMVLVYENSKGEQFELEEKDRTDKSILFAKDFTAAEAGTYTIKGVKYYVKDDTGKDIEEYFAFDDVEIGADFEVVSENKAGGADENITVVENSGDSVNSSSVKKQVKQALSSADVDTSTAPKSRAASNVVVVLDPGHGGSDVGSRYGSFYERDVNLKIAQACYDELRQYNGVSVYMTRTNNTSTNLSLAQRATFAKSKGASVLVSMHINAGGGGSATGVEIWKPNKNYNYSVYTQGAGLSSSILSELTKLGLYNRGLKERLTANNTKYPDGSLADYYGIIRESKSRGITGIIIEHAFIDNANDRAFLQNDNNLVKLGQADAKGIATYFRLERFGLFNDGKGIKYKNTDGSYFQNGWLTVGVNRYYFVDGYAVTGWQTIDNNKYYFMPDGHAITGWFSFGSTRYYANGSGVVLKGLQAIGGKTYLLDPESGIMQTGWQTINSNKYYFMPDGRAVTGWFSFGSTRYYANGSGVVQTGKKTINGVEYWFNDDGILLKEGWKVGWETKNGKKYYYDSNGVMQKGWRTIGESRYYFMPDGHAITGWFSFGPTRYYANGSGVVLKGLQTIGGKTYLLDAGSGIMQTGWKTVGDSKYYFMPDGRAVTGWFSFGSTRYYANGSGVVLKGLQAIGGKTYLLDAGSGIMQTGWKTVGGSKYYFMPDGRAVTGWFSFGSTRYHADGSGMVQTGKKTINGVEYWFNDDGILLKEGWKAGWETKNGKKYYYDSNGVMQKGWQTIGESRYYFMPDGYAITGWFSFGPTRYYANGSGVVLKGLQTIGGKTYLLDAGSGIMQTGWKTIGKDRYFFMPDGHAITGWFSFGPTRYYANGSGVVQTGTVTINGVPYEFDSEGRLLGYAISGTSLTTVDQMVRYYQSSGKTYPSSTYSSKGAKTIRDFCKIYYEEAEAEGIRAEVAFCQAMKETGWLQFGGDVIPSQCNFAGIGATGGGAAGATFANVRIGVRAQIQHLKAYANSAVLKNPCVDPRFTYVTRGTAPYVEWLGIKENPYGKGWATAKNYGYDIVAMIKTLRSR